MNPAERFEDLRIWQEARVLANAIYDATEGLRDFDFRSQMRSASVSVMNNVAEGFERKTDADFAHFLDVAKGSAGEVRSMLYLAEDRRFVASNDSLRLRAAALALSKGIAQLAKYLRSNTNKGSI
jgi:four helix bundle protein